SLVPPMRRWQRRASLHRPNGRRSTAGPHQSTSSKLYSLLGGEGRGRLARLALVSRTDAERLQDLREQVVELYRTNRRQGHAAWRDADYDYTCPSADTYPFQWFWDSCFHAIVLSRLDPPRAEAEVRTLLLTQRED